MAKLMLIGDMATVELTSDPEEGGTIATCVEHVHDGEKLAGWCVWTERYDTLDDASEYATDHTDFNVMRGGDTGVSRAAAELDAPRADHLKGR